MKKYAVEALRNVGLFGHQGSGKTSLAEAMLFTSGAIDRIGRTDEGSAVTDFDGEEVRRKISINNGLAPCEWGSTKINVVDVPGYLDFEGEVRAALRVISAAIIVTPVQGEPGVGFDVAWDLSGAASIPRAVFVNKMDRENADYFALLDNLREHHGPCIAPVQLPIGSASEFVGLVDLIHQKAYTGIGREFSEIPIPADMVELVSAYREKLVESAAEGADDLMEKFFDQGTLTDEEVVRGLHEGIDACRVVPVMCGSALRNMGAATLMNLIAEAFPNPAELGAIPVQLPDGRDALRQATDSEPLTALVFKTIADPFVGQLTYFRVLSGTIKSDSHILNANSGKDERIGQLYVVRGKYQETALEIGAGDIGAVAKLSHTHTGDTLCEHANPATVPSIVFPEPVYEIAVAAKTKVDEDKMGPALQRVASEDPCFKFRRVPESGQTVISGMGETHLHIVLEKLKKFGSAVEAHPVRIPYRETIRSKAEGQGKHKKQSGGRGQYGDCHLRLEPQARGEGFKFVDEIVGGAIPRQYIPAVEKGVLEVMTHGLLCGSPVVDVKCTVFDGSYHDVDSSEAAFRMAGIQAFHTVSQLAHPILLEPIMDVSVTVPESMMGDIMSDLSGKRGRIMGTESLGNKKTCVSALVPASEMTRYAIELRSISHGRGTFCAMQSHYEEAPAEVTHVVSSEYQKQKDDHSSSH